MFVFCQDTAKDNVEKESEDEDKLKESEDEDKLEKESEDEDKLEESEDEDKLEKESENDKVDEVQARLLQQESGADTIRHFFPSPLPFPHPLPCCGVSPPLPFPPLARPCAGFLWRIVPPHPPSPPPPPWIIRFRKLS